MFSATLAIQASASRVMFSMARDNRLPFGKFLSKVNKRTGTPVITGIAVSTLAILVLLVNIGQSSVFAAIASVSVVIVYIAYLMVTVPALIHRLRGTSLSYGPPVMDLGKWGIPVNLIAVVMGGLLVINIGWPRAEVYDPAGRPVVHAVLRGDLRGGHPGRRLHRLPRRAGTARVRPIRSTHWSARRSNAHLFGAPPLWRPSVRLGAKARVGESHFVDLGRCAAGFPGPDAMAPLPRSTKWCNALDILRPYVRFGAYGMSFGRLWALRDATRRGCRRPPRACPARSGCSPNHGVVRRLHGVPARPGTASRCPR